MPWNRPTLQTIINRMESDAEQRLTGNASLLRRAVVRVLVRVFAGAIHIVYGVVDWLARMIMPDTAETDWLDRHAYIWGVERKAASFASGYVVFTGTNGTTIPQGTEIQTDAGVIYETVADGVILNGFSRILCQAQEAGSDGNISNEEILTLVASIDNINDNVHVAIYTIGYTGLSGGTFSIGDNLNNTTQFGVGLVLSDNGSDEMTAIITEGVFEDTDSFDNGDGVSASVDGVPVNGNTISGGQDAESDDDLRARILLRIRSEPSGGTVADFNRWAKEVSGVADAWTYPVTPSPGFATVVVKATGADPVPGSTLLTAVEDYLDDRKPVTSDIVVVAIDKVVVDMTIERPANETDFESLITDNLEQLFENVAAPGEDMLISRMRNAISTTGVTDYDITAITLTPGGAQSIDDIGFSGYEYGVLGTLTYQDL